jgi:hypothetical protein
VYFVLLIHKFNPMKQHVDLGNQLEEVGFQIRGFLIKRRDYF